MKNIAFVLVAAACLAAPVQVMAQTKPAPAVEMKSASAEGWTPSKVLAVVGGAAIGFLAADILLPGFMMKNAIGVVGGAVLGYYGYSNELPPSPMDKRASNAEGDAKVMLTNINM